METDITLYKRQQDILAAIADFSRRLLQSDDLAAERNRMLAEVGRAANLTCACAYKVDPPIPLGQDGGAWIISQLYEWNNESTDSLYNNPEQQQLDLRDIGLGRWREQLAKGEPVIRNSRAEMTADEQRGMAHLGIYAICVFPIVVDGRVVGHIGFDIRGEKSAQRFEGWSDSVINALVGVGKRLCHGA